METCGQPCECPVLPDEESAIEKFLDGRDVYTDLHVDQHGDGICFSAYISDLDECKHFLIPNQELIENDYTNFPIFVFELFAGSHCLETACIRWENEDISLDEVQFIPHSLVELTLTNAKGLDVDLLGHVEALTLTEGNFDEVDFSPLAQLDNIYIFCYEVVCHSNVEEKYQLLSEVHTINSDIVGKVFDFEDETHQVIHDEDGYHLVEK